MGRTVSFFPKYEKAFSTILNATPKSATATHNCAHFGRRSVSKSEKFTPGRRVPTSGVFRVAHSGHRLEHHVSLLAGDLFPLCRTCGSAVRFELVERIAGN